jgi:hypothetical protein
MTISLTCACGLLLEVDEKFAGQQISCPDCHYCLQVPLAAPTEAAPLSRLALSSLLVALSTAFTLLGPLLATVLGVMALRRLRRAASPRSGWGLAWSGVVLGMGFSLLDLVLLLSGGGLVGEALLDWLQWNQLSKWESTGRQEPSLEVKRQGYSLTRPSQSWKVRKILPAQASSGEVGVLLVHGQTGAFVACMLVPVEDMATLDDCLERAKELFPHLDLTSVFGPGHKACWPHAVVWLQSKILPDRGEVESAELWAVKQSWRRARKFLLRVVHKRSDTYMYLLVAGSAAHRFAEQEEELRQVLESFRLLDRDRPPDW